MKTLSSILVLMSACYSALGQGSQSSPTASPSPTPQQLRIVSQPGAPLRISSARVTWATPDDRRGVQIYIQVENVGAKSVRTYETRRDVNSASGPKTCLGPGKIPGLLLRRGQKTGTSTWQGVFNSDPAPAVWIDFVEFADGTVWGADECQVAERLDGSRTGIRMQREQLLALLHEKGAEALMEFVHKNFKQPFDLSGYEHLLNSVASGTIEKPVLPVWPSNGHSRKWELAFLAGAAGTIQQVIEAYRAWGADEIEHVLTRPVVATEKN